MKILQVVPRRDIEGRLKSLLNAKERELRGSRTTFFRKAPGRWQHKTYKGSIKWESVPGGILVAEVVSPEESEWQLLQSFIGYLDRHLSEHIESVSILYR